MPPNPSQSITIALPSFIESNSGNNQSPFVHGFTVPLTLNPEPFNPILFSKKLFPVRDLPTIDITPKEFSLMEDKNYSDCLFNSKHFSFSLKVMKGIDFILFFLILFFQLVIFIKLKQILIF